MVRAAAWRLGCSFVMALAAPGLAQAQQSIKIGISLPLSGGSGAYFQKEIVAPATLALDELNAKGGILGRKIEYIVEDNKSDAPTGASIARKLITIDKVQMIFAVSTPAVFATLPIADDNDMLIMTIAEHPKLTTSPWVARCALNSAMYGSVSADYAYKTLGARTAGVIGEDNDAIRTTDETFKRDFEALGGKVVAMEGFKTGDQDLRAQLTKIKAGNPDLVLIESSGSRAYGLGLKQAAEIGLSPKYRLGRDEALVPEAREIAGDLLKGLYYVGVTVDQNWVDKTFKPHFGYSPDSQAAKAYDCMKIYARAVEQAGDSDPKKVREKLFHLHDFEGAVGKWGFTGSGEPDMKLMVSQIKE